MLNLLKKQVFFVRFKTVVVLRIEYNRPNQFTEFGGSVGNSDFLVCLSVSCFTGC